MIIHAIVHSYDLAMTLGPLGLCQQVMTPVQEVGGKAMQLPHDCVQRKVLFANTHKH